MLSPTPAHTTSVVPPTLGSIADDADFDGDGFPDVALGTGRMTRGEPLDDIDDDIVIVVYGSAEGLTAKRTQAWSETDFGGAASEGFGWALAFGDFDGDRYSDLAIGNGDAAVGSAKEHAGTVRVMYGSPTGLTAHRSQLWSQNTPGVAGHTESHDGFGSALVAANFGYGPHDDLAIGVHGENHDAGAVNILYGSPAGLTSDHNQIWDQASPGVPGSPERDDAFGVALVAGQFRESGYADLAIGIYLERVDTIAGAGAVIVLNGSPTGISAQGSRRLTQESLGVAPTKPSAISFGFAMASGRFAGGPTDDLAIGTPYDADRGGTVTIVYGSPTGLRTDRTQLLSQATAGIAGRVEFDDGFGFSLTAGDFGRDQQGRAFEDLAIRAPGEETTSIETGGAVTVVYGSQRGLITTGSQTITEQIADDLGTDVGQTRQLASIASGEHGTDDLLIGSLDWLHVISSTSAGLDTSQQQRWTSTTLGHPDVWFGLASTITG